MKKRLDEGTPLLRKKLFGDRPVLYHTASLREGTSLKNIHMKEEKKVKSSWIKRVYKIKTHAEAAMAGKIPKTPSEEEEDEYNDYNNQQNDH